MYKVLSGFCERTRTRLAVRRLSRRIGRRSYEALDGRAHEWDATDVALAVILVLHSHDEAGGYHAERTRLLSERVASELGLAPEIAQTTSHACALHDIGKICVPGRILNKPGTLDEDEWSVMRRHSEIGADILSRIGVSERVRAAVLAHHERFDGSGYPAGLSGEDIPMEARIISVVDAYDTMTNDRPYRKALSQEGALEQLRLHSGSQFDPAVVEATTDALDETRS